MSVTPESVGTEPVVVDPAAGGGGAGEPTPASDGDVQAKYEALLERLTALETGKQAAEEERDTLLSRINERLEPSTLHQAQPGAEDIAAFESQLAYTASNATDPNERRAASWMLGLAAYVRGMPSQFSEQMAMAPLDKTTRQQVQEVMKEAAASGNRITPEFARELVSMRAAQDELTKLRAQPAPPPPNTRVVPSPVPLNASGNVTYAQMNAEWPTATPARKDELRALERAGKVVPG